MSPRPIGLAEEVLRVAGVLGLDQFFQELVEVTLNPFAENEAVLAGEAARGMAELRQGLEKCLQSSVSSGQAPPRL